MLGLGRNSHRPGAVGRAKRLSAVGLVGLTVVLLVGLLTIVIARAQSDSRAKVLANFALRGQSSATLVSTFVAQQAERQKVTAEHFLAGAAVSPKRFAVIASAFGSSAAVLLDSHGRELTSVPVDRALVGKQLAARYEHLTMAEHGRIGVSNIVPSAVLHEQVTAFAVPFATPRGRRVFSAAYQISSAELQAFVDHAIAYPQHDVLLLDEASQVLAASPVANGDITRANPALAEALTRASHGSVRGIGTPSTFTSAAIPGTPWRIVLEVPDYKLYATIGGMAGLVPWIVLGIVTLLGCLLVFVFTRMVADRARLRVLSAELRHAARTDALTGLDNRRALSEHMTRAAAHARRHQTPMSVLMMDLDRFKETNDNFGHEAGDRVLCMVADCMRDVLRAEDVYGRLGGDEFMVVLGEADEPAALRAADRLREALAHCDVADIGLPEGVPVSIGSATAVHTTPDEIMRAADVELYRVKDARRSSTAGTRVAGRAT